jgi:hypothetical protein
MREAEVMAALTATLARRHGPETLIVPELGLCQAEARIDLAMVNGHLTGWEVKTAADTLVRLPRQESVYSRVFDRMWLAADARHVESALDLIPAWWGVCEIVSTDAGVRFRKVRDGRINRSVDLHAIVRLLWRDEVLEELDAIGLAQGHGRSPKTVLWDELAGAAPKYVSPTHLRRRVRERLRTRPGWRSASPRTSGGGSS